MANLGIEQGPEPSKQGELRSVTHRISIGICAERDVETERCPQSHEGLVSDVRRLAVLDPTDLRRGDPDGGSELALRQRCLDPGLAQFLADRKEGPLRLPSSAVEATFMRWHRCMMPTTNSQAINRD
jgi:hypothetical protein